MLHINNLHAKVEDKDILKGINLIVNAGEVHAIMGPNGSGKSTLASVIAGKDEFEISQGEIIFEGADISEIDPEERAHKGIFMSFQYPVEIPGVSVTNFIKTAINENTARSVQLHISMTSKLVGLTSGTKTRTERCSTLTHSTVQRSQHRASWCHWLKTFSRQTEQSKFLLYCSPSLERK